MDSGVEWIFFCNFAVLKFRVGLMWDKCPAMFIIHSYRRMKRIGIWMMLALLIVLAGCGKGDNFKVSGVIDGADDFSVVVEKADFNGVWQPIDSTRTDRNGQFEMKVHSAGVPEIYRLVIDKRYIYFPVDSTENINVETTMAGFGVTYTLSGSRQAELFAEFDRDVMHLAALNKDSVENFKRNCFNRYIKDGKGNLLSYYILTKSVNGKLLFDPSVTSDVKYYSAVATIYKQFNPEDPRADILEKMAIQGMKKRNREMGKKVVVNANERKVVEVTLPGIDGKPHTLSSVMIQGKPTVVAFTSIKDASNPALTLKLRELYDKRGGNLTIYHVNVDGDRYAWRDAAGNLPWTSVYADSRVDGVPLRDYNVSSVPTFFIYSPAGELTDRAENIEGLESILGAY